MEEETINLSDATVKLRRGVPVMWGAEKRIGSHMIIDYRLGNTKEVLIVEDAGQLRVKGVSLQMEVHSSSPAVPASTSFQKSLFDVDAETEKQMLAIYKRFPAQQ